MLLIAMYTFLSVCTYSRFNKASLCQQSISNLERVHLLLTEEYLSNKQPACERKQSFKRENSENRLISNSKLITKQFSCESLALRFKSVSMENNLSLDRCLCIANFQESNSTVSDEILQVAPAKLDGKCTNKSAKGKLLLSTCINTAKTSTPDKINMNLTSDSEKNTQISFNSRYGTESRKMKLHKDTDLCQNGLSQVCCSKKSKDYKRNGKIKL